MTECKITRVEVIDENGRSYVNWNENNRIECSIQDEGRTLKVFVNKSPQTLFDVMRNKLGYSVDCSDEIVDAVKEWLPKEQSAAGSQRMEVECSVEGFNDCLKKITQKLR